MPGEDDARIAAALSIAYLTAIASEALRTFPLDLLDLLLVITVAAANTARPAEPPRKNRGAPTSPSGKTGVSRNAVSRTLNVPLETVRRRVAGLIEKNILLDRADGLVFTPDNPIGLGHNAEFNACNIEMLGQLFHGLKANGIKFD